MAKQQVANQEEDFFGGEEVARTDLPRVAIGDGETTKAGTETFKQLQGFYESTVSQMIDGKTRYLHQLRLPKAINPITEDMPVPRVLVWGNYTIDQDLPTLPKDTKVRLTYQGIQDRGQGRKQKMIKVEYPASVQRVANPNQVQSLPDDDVPF